MSHLVVLVITIRGSICLGRPLGAQFYRFTPFPQLRVWANLPLGCCCEAATERNHKKDEEHQDSLVLFAS